MQDTLNRYDIMRGYTYFTVPARERIIQTDVPLGVHVRYRSCLPTPAYACRRPRAKVEYLRNSLPGVLVHVVNHPPPADDREYFVKKCTGPRNIDRDKL
jgi:hypothetical protein